MKRDEIDKLVEEAFSGFRISHRSGVRSTRAAIVKALEAQREADAKLCAANQLSYSASIIRSRPVEE